MAGGVEERVGARVGVAVGADERVGELQRAAVRGDVAERVPPPAWLSAGELFGVEVPDLSGLLADEAGGGVEVGLVGGRERGGGCGEERGDRAGGGLASPRAPDVALLVLPGREQRLAVADGARDREAFLGDAEALRGRPRVLRARPGGCRVRVPSSARRDRRGCVVTRCAIAM